MGTGHLREDLFRDLLVCERKADLVVAVGSSLCGMNSDRLVSTCADRARHTVPSDSVHGSVIVALQKTVHDKESSVRIFATINHTMELLMEALSITIPTVANVLKPPETFLPLGPDVEVFLVPYDENGHLDKSGARRSWDLREGAQHTIVVGKHKGDRAVILGKNPQGHYRVGISKNDEPPNEGQYNEVRLMGNWWVTSATEGDVDLLPIIGHEA